MITWDLPGCGIAWVRTHTSGRTFSVTRKACALGGFTFGHEIGHNFGCYHNPEQYSEEDQLWHGHAHGHLIDKGSASTGVRSILAYNADGHGTRVNYYSNPDVTYLSTGTPTGVRGISNNAAVITDNRWVVTLICSENNVWCI